MATDPRARRRLSKPDVDEDDSRVVPLTIDVPVPAPSPAGLAGLPSMATVGGRLSAASAATPITHPNASSRRVNMSPVTSLANIGRRHSNAGSQGGGVGGGRRGSHPGSVNGSARSNRARKPSGSVGGGGASARPATARAAMLAAAAGINDFQMRPMTFLTLVPSFSNPITELAYQSHRADVALARVTRTLPLIWLVCILFGIVDFVGLAILEPRYREPNLHSRMIKVAIGLGSGLVSGPILFILIRRSSAFFRAHYVIILTITAVVNNGAVFLATIDYVHPYALFFPAAWCSDTAARGLLLLPPHGSVAVNLLTVLLIWIVYPSLGVVESFSQYLGMALILFGALPLSAALAREDDLKRRGDFVRAVRDAADRRGLQARNEGLHAMLRRIQEEQLQSGGRAADLDSPLAKAVDALANLRCDPRLIELCDWATAVIDDAVSLLLHSGSVLLPDFGQQLRDGTLRLDNDVGRWLFNEIVPAQKEAAAAAAANSGFGSIKDGERRGSAASGGHDGSRSPLKQTPRMDSVVGVAVAVQRWRRHSLTVESPISDRVDAAARRLVGTVLDTWADVDILEVERATGGSPLLAVSVAAASGLGLLERLEIPVEKFASFVVALERGYLENPYHNRAHAADVTRNMAFLLGRGGLAPCLTDLEQLAAIVACAMHDYEHPGVNNNFLTSTAAPLAILYNDRSPLEAHHVAASWALLRQPEHCFVEHLPPAALREMRRAVIDAVLSTDMSQHFEVLGSFRKRASANFLSPNAEAKRKVDVKRTVAMIGRSRSMLHVIPSGHVDAPSPEPLDRLNAGTPDEMADPVPSSEELQPDDRRLILSAAIKVCDIGHAAKPLELHCVWSQAIQEEFFAQGDKERELGLEVSAFMDRQQLNFPKSQIGFMDFIVLPLLTALASVFPNTSVIVDRATDNYKHWQQEHQKGLSASPPPVSAVPPGGV